MTLCNNKNVCECSSIDAVRSYSNDFVDDWNFGLKSFNSQTVYCVFHYLCVMGSIRQNKIEGVIQEELSTCLQRNAREICLGAMVSVTQVRITADLSLARCYLSIFAGPTKEEVLESVKIHSGKIRGDIGKRLKTMKKLPQLAFYIDDSLDYAMEINELLKK